MQIHHLRNATMLLTLGQHRLLIDPLLGKPGVMPGFKMFGGGRKPNPLVPLPPQAEACLAQATAVLITHEHPDHFDAAGIEWVRARKLPVWASSIDLPSLRRKGLDAHELRDGDLGLSVEAIPGQHGRGPLGWLMGQVSGFYLAHPDEPSVYLTSDSVLSDTVVAAMARLKPEVVVAPAGSANMGLGGDILFSFEELITLAKQAPREVVFNHLEALDHCPTTRDALRKRIAEEGLSARVHIPSDGEVLHFQRQDAAPHPRTQPFVSRAPGFQKWLTSKLG